MMLRKQRYTQGSDIVSTYFRMLGGQLEDFDTETTRRVIQFCIELDSKRSYDRLTTFPSDTDEMIIGNNLRLFSFCEHHLLPFFGKVHIGYIPNGKIFGLSKFQRLVDTVASKPQLQERLTNEIAQYVIKHLEPQGVGVVVKAIRTCVFARGVHNPAGVYN